MNFKVRMRNPLFWITIIPSIVALVYNILSSFKITTPISQDVFVQFSTTIISALTTLGVLIDPTTKGVSDSVQAMTYTKPK